MASLAFMVSAAKACLVLLTRYLGTKYLCPSGPTMHVKPEGMCDGAADWEAISQWVI
jgi:hypothetical protein